MTGTVLVKYSCRFKIYGCQNQATRQGYCDDCYSDIVNRNNNKRTRRVQNLSDSFDFGDAVMPRDNKAKTAKTKPATEKKVSTRKARQKTEKSSRKKRSTSATKQVKGDAKTQSTNPAKEKTVKQKKIKEKVVKPEPPIVKSFAIPTPKCAHPNCRKRSYQDNLCEFHFNQKEGNPTQNKELIDRIKPLYESGMPIREIAKTVGGDYTSIRSLIQYHRNRKYISLEKREKELRKLNKDSAETLDTIKELYEKGMPIPEIAETLGLRRTQVNGKIQWYCSTGKISRQRRADNIKALNE